MAPVMRTQEGHAAAEVALSDWRDRRASVDADRDRVILAALDAGVSTVRIQELSGLSRMTISQIRDPKGPLAIAEKARRALRVKRVTVPEIRTAGGRVLLSLPVDDWTPDALDDMGVGGEERAKARSTAQLVHRMNWAASVLTILTAAGIDAAPLEPQQCDTYEYLAREDEPEAVLTLAADNGHAA